MTIWGKKPWPGDLRFRSLCMGPYWEVELCIYGNTWQFAYSICGCGYNALVFVNLR